MLNKLVRPRIGHEEYFQAVKKEPDIDTSLCRDLIRAKCQSNAKLQVKVGHIRFISKSEIKKAFQSESNLKEFVDDLALGGYKQLLLKRGE